jgi:uncharacterized protein (TIGR03437 family)
LFVSTNSATNLQTLSTAYPASFALNAVVEATAAEYAAPTSPITLYEGSTALGTATLGGNGTLASLALTGVSAGTHTYTAQYPADSSYSALAFGLVTVTVNAASIPPVINAAQNAEGGSQSIAPNTWVAIKGTGLAPSGDTRIWQGSDFVSNQMPTALDGVSVTMNGENAYVYYISPVQLNILTPPDLATGTVQVKVTANGHTSTAFTVQVQTYSLAFFVFNGGPYVIGTHLNGSIVGPPTLYPGASTPAQPGEEVVLYANGFGAKSSAIAKGSAIQSGTLPVMPVIQIGGAPATLIFAGLVSRGLYQFNVYVPSSAANGDNTLTAQYNGQSTQTGVLLTVQSNSSPSVESQ